MSQHRECCCGPEQNFALECLASDKIFPHGVAENTLGDRRGSNQSQVTAPKGRSAGMFIDEQQFYKSRGGAGAAGPRHLTANNANVFEVSGRGIVGNKLKTRNPDNTTGMGCMLCHGTLIMTTKLPSHTARSMGSVSTSCSTADGCSRTKFVSYDHSGWNLPAEETMYTMYNAYKDYWYLELGPMGLPHSFYSQRRRYQESRIVGGLPIQTEGLGIRTFGGDNPTFDKCWFFMQHPPTPTDADLMGFPELTACTNPANVMFDDRNIPEASNSIRNAFNAWQTGVDNNEPEYANHETVLNDSGGFVGVGGNWLCTYNISNRNPWVSIYAPRDPIIGANPPCGGDFMPGISSWQAYQLRSQPELRSLGDAMSYGNGAPIFASPSSMIEQNLAPYSSDIAYAPLANAMIGTLHRVRLWMRADQVTIDGAFPCTDDAGQHHAYYPPETNTKMFARNSRPAFGEVGSGFGYNVLQKICSSGPASLMYACSGVPIFTSDIETLTENGQYPGNGILDNLQTLYYGDWSYIEELIGDITSAKCKFGIGQIEEALGETGLFVAKDWRQDQIDKYVSLGSSFKTIAAQNVDNPDLSESNLAALRAFSSDDFQGVPASISERISPSSNIELLPSQKIGEQMLTCFITQAGPKQLADVEINTDESQEQVLLSEMAYFQGSEFLGQGQGFAIDAIDPWHPKNSGGDWPKLGRRRNDPATGQSMIISLTDPSGNGDEFQFYYPIRSIWNAWRASNNPSAGNFSDAEWDQVSPGWEQDLFKAWWKNNPIYFHATPGGFGWGGDGAGQDLAHPPGTLYASSECRWSNDLRKLKNLESINQLGMYGTQRAAIICGNKDTWPVEVQKGVVPGGLDSGSTIVHGRQLRNKPSIRVCSSASAGCFATPAGDGAYSINCAGEDENPACCYGTSRCALWNVGGSGTCTGFGGGPDGDGPIDNGGGDPGEPGDDNGNGCHDVAQNFGLVTRNCCRNYNPYGGSNSAGSFATATSSVFQENPTNINSTDSNGTVSLWNKNNPTVSFRDGSLYGSRCTERGECPPGFKCCSVAGCGADSFCIPEAAECTSPPCTSSENFDSPCCQTFGSCCYEDDDGLIRCEDDITQEKCVARKENGGLNGTFTKDVTCRSYPCKTQGVITGACFYTDPLLNHQICRQTTSETCAGFSGEFFADQKCDDITDKIITGYETKVDTLGAKPSLAGDRTCGEFGFSVNCCTQNPDGTQTCEVKCLSDCDYGVNGTSRIVQSCDSCGEFGHCCTRNGICEPSVIESDCSGTWFPGEECDGRSCEIPLSENQLTKNFGGAPGYRAGDGFGGGDDEFPEDVIIDVDDPNCVPGPCEGSQLPPSFTLDICLPNNRFGNVAAISTPLPPGGPESGPIACLVSADPQASRTCLIKQIQVTRSGMRYAVFTSSQRADGIGGICPTGGGGIVPCCTYKCNPRAHYDGARACQPNTDDDQVPNLHQDLPTLVANVYPFRIRCAQTRDESGLYKCAVKPEATPVSEQELAQGIIGCGDLYTCHKQFISPGPDTEVETGTCNGENAACGDPQQGGCDNETTVGSEYARYSNDISYELLYSPDVTNINPGSACFDLRNSLHHAQSIAFPSPSGGIDSGAVGQHLYAPAEGIYGVFTPHELSLPVRRPLNPQSIDQLPMGTLGQCAEFYNDKLLSDFEDTGFPKPPEPTTLLTFHDYGGLLNTYEDNRTDPPTDTPLGIVDGAPIKAELVDANWNAGQNEETFWMKQEFPSLKYIRFFSAGCFRLPGSHQGGQGIMLDEGTDLEQRVGGDFAGTLVPVFGSAEDRNRYDEYYGSENLKLSFVTTPPGYPTGPGDEINPAITDGEIYFVARPSNNLRKAAGYNTDPDNPQDPGDAGAGLYSRVGYLDGLGLTYANVSNDQVGEYDGKVYEFCVPVGKDTANVNQLKPIFTTGEEIPPFSGLRGPIGLFSDGSGDDGGRFIVDLKRFSETVVTEETLGECSRSWSYVIDLPEGQPDIDIIGNNFYQGSETDIDDGERCFFEGYLEEDSQGDDKIWNRSWFANLSGITDGGSIGCCHHNNENLECTGWELGGAGQNAGNNVFRRANTSDDCRADL